MTSRTLQHKMMGYLYTTACPMHVQRTYPEGGTSTKIEIASFGLFLVLLFCLYAPTLHAQSLPYPADSSVISNHQVTIGEQTVSYEAEAGTQPVYNEDDETIASLFYVYYEREDGGAVGERPLVFSFNGGPGSSSVWMHIGYTGPRFLEIDSEGHPIQPYGISENEHSILDVADIVYIDPVNTGFSRILDDDVDRDTFFGVEADISYLAEWIDTFVSRKGRWASPKFLIGESYGTTRVAGLARQLQGNHWMHLNGVILVSPTGMGIDREGPVGDALSLPYYTATAWYHGQLPSDLQQQDLEEILPDVEDFTIEEYIPALARGGSLSDQERTHVAETVSRFSGISEQDIRNHNLTIPTSFFWKDLLRHEGLTIGRLDSRYRGQDQQDAGERYDHDPALTAWNHAFAPAINHYLREELGYESDRQYWIFGPVNPWDRSGNTTGEDLSRAMAENPFLHLMVQSGYYDGATDYFAAKYTMWNMDAAGRLQERMRFETYRSGHMMYLRQEDLQTSNQHIREFIREAIPEEREPASY